MDSDGQRQGMKNQGPMTPPLMVTRLLLFLVLLLPLRSLAGEQATAVATLISSAFGRMIAANESNAAR